MRKRVVSIVKLGLVAALLGYVFSTIQWSDAYTRTDQHGEVVETVSGSIVGRWDGEQVRFVPAAEDGEQVLEPGVLPDGSALSVVPGFWTYLANLDKLLFALAALCYLGPLTVASTRWWWLLRVNGLDVRWREVLRFTWIGVFFNNVVPGQTGGDVVKALYIIKRCPDGRVEALMSVIVDRILGLGSLAFLGAVVVLFQVERFGPIAFGIWGVLGFVCLIGVFAFSRRVRRLVRIDQLLRKLPAKLAGPLMRVDQAIHFYRAHKRGVFVWLLVGVLNHVGTVTVFVLMGRALGVGMPATEYFVLIPVILMVSAVPIAPNGWGVGEALFQTLFGTYGAMYVPAGTPNPGQVIATRGVALSILYRIHTTIWSLVGGFLLLSDDQRVSRAEIDEELAREEREAADGID